MAQPERTPAPHETSIFKIVELATELANDRIYFMGQRGPKLTGTYALIDVGGHSALGTPTRKLTTEVLGSGFKHIVTSSRQGIVEIQVFGLAHRTIMERLTLALSSPEVMLLEKQEGISLEEGQTLIIIDREDRDTLWDERSVKEFTYRFTATHESEAVDIQTLVATPIII